MVQTELIFAIARIPSLTWKERLKLTSLIDSVESLGVLSKEDLFVMIERVPHTKVKWDIDKVIVLAKKDAESLSRVNGGFVWIGDEKYPSLLRELYDPPFLLFFRGNYLGLVNSPSDCVAMVGTRRPANWAVNWAIERGAFFAKKYVPVVSGLAYGIDSAAHRGAIIGQGFTVAVLPSGVNSVYPRGNVSLAARILETGGLLISEYPPEEKALTWHFPQRNRIISGLSRGVIVVAAPEKSGALITSDFAAQQNREVFVPKDNLGSAGTEGTQKLAEDGATVIESCKIGRAHV